MLAAAPSMLPPWLLQAILLAEEPPQNLKEYDPEWARAFWSGAATMNCSNDRMLKSVKVPVLFTHHFRMIDDAMGALSGAISDLQVSYARKLIESAGQRLEYRSFPEMGHSMHEQDPNLYVETLRTWAQTVS